MQFALFAVAAALLNRETATCNPKTEVRRCDAFGKVDKVYLRAFVKLVVPSIA